MLAGSETWTYALACQFKKMGHFVACYSPELGIISDKLREQGIRSYSNISMGKIKPFSYVLEEDEKHEYDVIIANHFHIVATLRQKFPNTPIISTIHGILHFDEKGLWAPEHPATESGVAQFIAVSEEVKDLLQKEYNIDSTIIRNGFDLSRFSQLKAPHDKPQQFLVNTNYQDRNDPAILVIKEAAKHFGAKVTAIGYNFTAQWDISRAIEDSDIVFGMGRSVLEGLAAGRLGICHGRWGTAGVIRESSVEVIRAQNFSGRNSGGVTATAAELIKMIEEFYNPAVLDWSKKYIAREHNIVNVAEHYLRITNDLTGRTINAAPGIKKLKRNYE